MRLDAMRCARTRERTRGGRSGDDQTDVATSASARVRRGRAPGARCAPRALLFVESVFFCRETGLVVLVSKKYASATIARRRHTSPPPTMASTLAFHPALAAASAPRARSRRASDPSRATLRSRAPPKRTTRSSPVGTSASSSSSSSSSVAVADDDTDAIDGVVPAFGPGSPPWPVVHAELKAATRGTVRTIYPEEAKRTIDAGGAALADVRPRIEHEEFRPGAAADDDAAATSTSSSSTSSSSSAKYVVNVPYMVPHRSVAKRWQGYMLCTKDGLKERDPTFTRSFAAAFPDKSAPIVVACKSGGDISQEPITIDPTTKRQVIPKGSSVHGQEQVAVVVRDLRASTSRVHELVSPRRRRH